MKTLRNAVPLLALAALAAAGCFLISGQFAVTYELPPLHVTSAVTLSGTDVDLNTIGEYNDHKADLKRVDDLAITGEFKNNSGSAADVQVWLVPTGGAVNLTPTQVDAQGVRLWGPLPVAAGATETVNWNRSAKLFANRQALIDEIKGDGHFALYVVAFGAFDITVTRGAIIAIVGAAK